MITAVNSSASLQQFEQIIDSPYYVDKTMLIAQLSRYIGTEDRYICVTRPRRFGKTTAAETLAAFYTKGFDSSECFDGLAVSKDPAYRTHLNRYNVITMNMSELPEVCNSYGDYIFSVISKLKKQLAKEFGSFEPSESLSDYLTRLNDETDENGIHLKTSFIFVIDEWDAIFQKRFMTDEDKQDYLKFLSGLLKDKPYVALAYMTGVLPIPKYSSTSALNMFMEYSAASTTVLGEYFGFTDEEVDDVYSRFLQNCRTCPKPVSPKVSREELTQWYKGYYGNGTSRIYNPMSIVSALDMNKAASYWTHTGPYDEVANTIRENVDAVIEDVVRLVAGEKAKTLVCEFSAASADEPTREQLLSRMVVYGFLTSMAAEGPDSQTDVWIPNKELMLQFQNALNRKEMGYVQQLASQSAKLLSATLSSDTDTVISVLKSAHDQEIPVLRYNNEGDLGALVSLMYLSARSRYDVKREGKAGSGYADFTFAPNVKTDTCFIVELKKDASPFAAIDQIKSSGYLARFGPDIYTGEVLAVGITYDSRAKIHDCKIEVLRDAVRN